MDKMPVDTFGYYTLLEPYIGAYYEVEAKEKARQLFKDVSIKYQENLNYYSSLSEKNQTQQIENIYTDIGRYRGLVDVLMIYEDEDFIKAEMRKFNSYLRLFTGDEEEEEEERIENDLPPVTDSIKVDSIDLE